MRMVALRVLAIACILSTTATCSIEVGQCFSLAAVDQLMDLLSETDWHVNSPSSIQPLRSVVCITIRPCTHDASQVTLSLWCISGFTKEG